MKGDYCWDAGGVAGTGAAGGATPGLPTSAAGLAGGFGIYNGPVWPQAVNRTVAATTGNAKVNFTIRISV